MINRIDGVLCNGLKEGRMGLGLVRCSGRVAGVFTRNRFKAAPVVLTMRTVRRGRIEGIIANSGIANAFTGEEGIRRAERMAELLADCIGTSRDRIAVASTGVIGVQLNIDWIESRFWDVFRGMGRTDEHALRFARSIMTTDRFPKLCLREKGFKIAGVAKGAGMIAPNMGTMLSFIFTDADVSRSGMRKALRFAVDRSFNVTVVDGDTSTNDMVLLVSLPKRDVDYEEFKTALKDVCVELARMIARDGEGATKLITVKVRGARNDREAFRAAKAVVSSNLVKAAVYGCDPNWGRIIAALGSSGVQVDKRISIALEAYKGGKAIGRVELVRRGVATMREAEARRIMESCDEVVFEVDMNVGQGSGYAFGCDLTHEYVRINAEYTT